MFRMLPTYKCRHFPQHFLSAGTHHQSYFSTAACAQILSNGTDENSKEVDFEFLFQSCTKIHLAKCLHALLCQGKPKAFSFPLELSTFMPILGMLLILTALSIRSQKMMPIPGIQCYPPMFAIPTSMKLSIVYTKCY